MQSKRDLAGTYAPRARGRRWPGAPGTVGAASCPRVEIPRRGWSGVLWPQTRAPGASAGPAQPDVFPGSIVCPEQRKQLGATPAHFQGSSIPPPRPCSPINHCRGKHQSPDFLSPSHICSTTASAPEEPLTVSSSRGRDPCTAPQPLTLRGHPTTSTAKAPWGEAAPGLVQICAGSSSASFTWPDITLYPAAERQDPPHRAMPARDGPAPASSRHHAEHKLAGSCTYTLSTWQDAPLKPTTVKPTLTS